MISHKSSLFVLLSLLRESTASNQIQGAITGYFNRYGSTVPDNPSLTVIHADVIAPSGSTAVIGFASSTLVDTPSSSTNLPMISSPCSSGSCPITSTPYEFHPAIATWIHHPEPTFSVPASTPVITSSPVQTSKGSPIASASGKKEPSSIPLSSSKPLVQTPAISQGGNTASATENNEPPSSPSSKSAPQAPVQNPTSPPLSEQTRSTWTLQPSNEPKPSKGPQSSNHPQSSNGPKPSNSAKPSNDPQSSNDVGSQNSPSSSESPATTPPPTTSHIQQSNIGTTPSFRLGSSLDGERMPSILASPTGSSSAEVAAMLSNRPTDTATAAWEDLESQMSQIPTSTTTGAAVATEGIELAFWLTKVNSNIQEADLKDRDTWDHVKTNLGDIEGRIDSYIRNRENNDNSGSSSSEGSDSGCSSGGGLAGIFKAVSCFVKKAEDKIKGDSKNIRPLIDEGLQITKSGFSQLKDKLPEPGDIQDDEEKEFKENFGTLTEGVESLEDLEKEEKKEKETSSSSSSTATSTASSETTTCTSTNTVKDCTFSTLFITSTITGSSGSLSPTVITSTTSTCSTQTGCDITATAETTTAYTQITGSCELRTTKFPSGYTKPPKVLITGTWNIPRGTFTTDSETITIASGSRTTPGTTFSTTTKASTTASTKSASTTTAAPCEVVSVQISSGYATLCACSQTTSTDTVTSTITAPSYGNCGDYTAFPTTGFIDTPPETLHDEMCGYYFGGRDGKHGYCACQTSADGAYSSQWVPLPHSQGSETVFDCHQITSVYFTPTSTQTTTATQALVTDYTSTDIGNGDIYAFATAYVTTQTSNYGNLPDFTPFPETVGVDTATFEKVDDYFTTDGFTTYYYAEATGDGDGDMTPVGTPTATAGPEATQNCVRYVIPGPDTNHVLNSATTEFIYAFWGIASWNSTDLDEKIPSLLKGCGVTEQIDVQENTGRWGTVAMWNNGREWDLTDCVDEGLEFLGAAALDNGKNCKEIPQASEKKSFWYEDSAPAEIDWIYDNYPHKISSPYPLST
ncbi:hypothetical protein PENPOL_c022G02255 [Penicillium polonicum]|uniref:Ig-like domain-containing protein n=1 Tax=Penicillium polonicum TaxID=60169 RepID=A0A1V6N7F6_PENPO|nr:hypothetical protein PENPOL_c022G02255 [Penicillium polonicum]